MNAVLCPIDFVSPNPQPPRPLVWIIAAIFMVCFSLFAHVAFSAEGDRSNHRIYFFTATWCVPCEKMKKKVWPDPSIQLLVNTYRAKHDLDFDDETTEKYKEYYEVEEVPTVIVVDSDRQELGRITGFASVDEVRELLE